jgi:hypothetical protein
LCCFSDNTSQNCFEQNIVECSVYDECSNLLDTEETSPSSVTYEDIKNACAKQYINTTGIEECHGICADHLCCFTNENLVSSCKNSPNKTCDMYKPCEILINGDDDPDNLVPQYSGPSSVTDECNADKVTTAEGKQACHDVCQQASCCFQDGIGNCYSMNKQWCDTFQTCSAVFTDGLGGGHVNGPVGKNLQQEIIELCKMEKLMMNVTGTGEESNKDICDRICDEYKCCASGTCPTGLQQSCSTYVGCQALFSLETQPPTPSGTPVPQDGLGACLEGNYSINPQPCVTHCIGAECCFASGANSCSQERELYCDQMNLCRIVFVSN